MGEALERAQVFMDRARRTLQPVAELAFLRPAWLKLRAPWIVAGYLSTRPANDNRLRPW